MLCQPALLICEYVFFTESPESERALFPCSHTDAFKSRSRAFDPLGMGVIQWDSVCNVPFTYLHSMELL